MGTAMIRWSKVKCRVEALLADSVAGRVAFHSTRYRKAHDQDGRAWITLDGEEIINMSTVAAWRMQYEMARRMQKEFDGEIWAYSIGWKMAAQTMAEESVFWQGKLGRAMFKYVNLGIGEILDNENVLIRAIGVLDRRVGKRRLRELLDRDEHPLVRRLLEFRCEAEGIPVREVADS